MRLGYSGVIVISISDICQFKLIYSPRASSDHNRRIKGRPCMPAGARNFVSVLIRQMLQLEISKVMARKQTLHLRLISAKNLLEGERALRRSARQILIDSKEHSGMFQPKMQKTPSPQGLRTDLPPVEPTSRNATCDIFSFFLHNPIRADNYPLCYWFLVQMSWLYDPCNTSLSLDPAAYMVYTWPQTSFCVTAKTRIIQHLPYNLRLLFSRLLKKLVDMPGFQIISCWLANAADCNACEQIFSTKRRH